MSASVVEEGMLVECEARRKERREGGLSAMLDKVLLGKKRVDLKGGGGRDGDQTLTLETLKPGKKTGCTNGGGSEWVMNATTADY